MNGLICPTRSREWGVFEKDEASTFRKVMLLLHCFIYNIRSVARVFLHGLFIFPHRNLTFSTGDAHGSCPITHGRNKLRPSHANSPPTSAAFGRHAPERRGYFAFEASAGRHVPRWRRYNAYNPAYRSHPVTYGRNRLRSSRVNSPPTSIAFGRHAPRRRGYNAYNLADRSRPVTYGRNKLRSSRVGGPLVLRLSRDGRFRMPRAEGGAGTSRVIPPFVPKRSLTFILLHIRK